MEKKNNKKIESKKIDVIEKESIKDLNIDKIITKYKSTFNHSKKKEYFVVVNDTNMEIYNYLDTAKTYNSDSKIYIIKNISRNGIIKNVNTDILCEICIKNNK